MAHAIALMRINEPRGQVAHQMMALIEGPQPSERPLDFPSRTETKPREPKPAEPFLSKWSFWHFQR
jgi:hypothetical protein